MEHEEIKEAVRSIIELIPKGLAFDSHYVIDGLLATEESTDTYQRFASPFADGNRPTLTTHQQISIQIIGSFCGTLIERMPYDSYSMTIHGRGGKCALWRRI